jgi:hypothetical protein
MLFTFGFVAAFVGMDITPEQSLTRFPDISAARTVENSLYLVVLLLWVIHSLALYRALRRTSPTPALFGTVLSILGLVVLAAGALPHVATGPALRSLSRSWGDRTGSDDPGAGVARHRRLAAATAALVGVPAMGAVGVFALIGFHLTLGWKTHRLARAPHSRMFAGV